MSLTLAESRARARALSAVSYEIDLDLTDPAEGTFGCRTTVRFDSADDCTFLELTGAQHLTVRVNGAPTGTTYDGRRVWLEGLQPHNEVVVDARLPYVTDGDGMHAFTDPADRETYVGAYLGMDIAQRVFACFDQVDLKAPIAVRVTADAAWTVLANSRPTRVGDGVWEFTTTPPIPPALVVVCAGPFVSHTWEHAGLPFGWHARRSLAAELERDAAELQAVTTDCFDHYAELFDEPYPFDCYDQIFVPGLNWGAQEMPGCVTYADELLPRGRLSEERRVFRASVIAHEMAHMWFGDLVTMTWWEDTWLQESFADYMGYRVAEEGAGISGPLVWHEIQRKSWAYDADARRSTHPVAPRAEDVPDVDAAATNFDAISYAKGNSVIRQLVTWLGDETFLAGVNVYLTRHRFGNATLDDFVAALDEASDRDVRGWVEVWLRRSGFDTVRVTRDGGVPVLTREGSRPHRLRVTAYDDQWGEVGSHLVDLADEPVRLDTWAGLVVVPNSHGETFARVALDAQSWAAVETGLSSATDDLVRAVLWTAAFDLVQSRRLSSGDYLALLRRHLPRETSPTIVAAVLRRTFWQVLPRRVDATEAGGAVAVVAAACREGLRRGTSEEQTAELARGLARTSRDAAELRGWVDGEAATQDPLRRWAAVARLAAIGEADAALVERIRRDDASVDGELGAVRALAARPTVEAKESAWAVLTDERVSNRVFEAVTDGLWSPEQAALLTPYVARYLDEAPGWAARGQAFAQVVGKAFPALPLDATHVRHLERALANDVTTVLRRFWEDELDDLR